MFRQVELLDFEVDGHADPAVLGDIALLGRDEAPELHCSQRVGVELITTTAFLDLDLTGFAAGQHMHPQQHCAFPTATQRQRWVFRRLILQVPTSAGCYNLRIIVTDNHEAKGNTGHSVTALIETFPQCLCANP